MTRAYKPRLSQPCENDFLISSFLLHVIFVSLSFVPQGLCVSGSMWHSHLGTVPSTHSHFKILLASSKTDSPWVFFPLFFSLALALSRFFFFFSNKLWPTSYTVLPFVLCYCMACHFTIETTKILYFPNLNLK